MIQRAAQRNFQNVIATLLFWAALLFWGSLALAEIKEVPVTGVGFGSTPADAVEDAVINAIAQVNGEYIAASTRSKEQTSTTANSDGGVSREISTELYESIDRKTKGVVASWKIISYEKTESGDFTALVSARIARLERSEQLDRKKIAVVWSRKGESDLSSELIEAVTRLLTNSRKFALLDRRNDAIIQDQLDRVRQGEGGIADQVRLESAEAPDFLVIAHVNVNKKSDSKEYAYGYLEIIDYATRQVKFSERKPMAIDKGKPETIPARMNSLAKSLTRELIASVFPPTVVASTDTDITVSQGQDFFTKGDEIIVFELGEILRDPATDEYLSREKNEVGRAIITYVDARIAKATLNEQARFNLREISRGRYVVSRTGTQPTKKTRKPISSDLLDE